VWPLRRRWPWQKRLLRIGCGASERCNTGGAGVTVLEGRGKGRVGLGERGTEWFEMSGLCMADASFALCVREMGLLFFLSTETF
jgi:hypothetical protein